MAPVSSVRRPLKPLLVLVVLLTAGAGNNESQQPQCTVSAQVVNPQTPFVCSGATWVVQGTEGAGPHPGRYLDFGVTQNLVGVCEWSYTACNGAGINIPEVDPSASIENISVSPSGVITVTVSETMQSASANPVACNCSDTANNGYNSVTMNGTSPTTQVFHGEC